MLRLVRIRGASSNVRTVTLTTTPKVPPPPPRRAQNRSLFWYSFATTSSPCSGIISMDLLEQGCVVVTYISSPDGELKGIIRSHPLPWSQGRMSTTLNIPPCSTNRVRSSGNNGSIPRGDSSVQLLQTDTGGYCNCRAFIFTFWCTSRSELVHKLDILHPIGKDLQRPWSGSTTQEIMP